MQMLIDDPTTAATDIPGQQVGYPDPGAIFASTADAYARYRPSHSPVLLDYISDLAKSRGGELPVLDLGCGTGAIALWLAERGSKVIAVDPSEEMLTAGRRLAAERHVSGIEWRIGDSTRLGELPAVRGVAVGDAFHYMDRAQTLRDLDAIVAPGGFLAIVVSLALGAPKPWWEALLDHVRDRYFGPNRLAGPGVPFRYLTEDHETVLRRSAFSRVRVLRTDHPVRLTLDELIGLQYTYAFSSLAVLGDRRDPYERELRAALSAAEPGGRFATTVQAQAIIGERQGAPRC
jgi:SAM-dependent methyltransferase